jgi:hypothetical protein
MSKSVVSKPLSKTIEHKDKNRQKDMFEAQSRFEENSQID